MNRRERRREWRVAFVLAYEINGPANLEKQYVLRRKGWFVFLNDSFPEFLIRSRQPPSVPPTPPYSPYKP